MFNQDMKFREVICLISFMYKFGGRFDPDLMDLKMHAVNHQAELYFQILTWRYITGKTIKAVCMCVCVSRTPLCILHNLGSIQNIWIIGHFLRKETEMDLTKGSAFDNQLKRKSLLF